MIRFPCNYDYSLASVVTCLKGSKGVDPGTDTPTLQLAHCCKLPLPFCVRLERMGELFLGDEFVGYALPH